MQIEKKYDVVVAGGGLAGVCAAAAAARTGCSVVLVERYGFMGGMATAGLVNPLQGHDTVSPDGEVIPVNNGGIYRMILQRMQSLQGIVRYGKHSWLPFNEEIMKLVLDTLISEFHIDLLLHSFIFDVEKTGRHIKGIRTAGKSGEILIQGDYFIDATGDGDLAYYSGCEVKMGREQDGLCQPMTLNFRIGDIDRDRVDRFLDRAEYDEKVNKLYKELKGLGRIKNPRENVLTFPHLIDSIVHFNSTRVTEKSGVDVFQLTESEMEARRQMYELFIFMKENVRGYKNSQLLMSAPQIGVRESRRITGLYEIKENDLLEFRKFEDSIARGRYCIDIHNPSGTGTMIKAIPEGEYYTIPYRSIVPKDMDNLLIAGRAISTTHEAHSAIRVMPICASVGESAGIASAVAASQKAAFADVPVGLIQKELDRCGGLY